MVTKLKRDTYQSFAKRLVEACERHPRMPKRNEPGFYRALGELAGIGYKGAEKWVKGESMPDMGHATILATRLGVGIDELLTGRGWKSSVVYEAREAMPRFRTASVNDELANDISSLPPKIRESLQILVTALKKEKP